MSEELYYDYGKRPSGRRAGQQRSVVVRQGDGDTFLEYDREAMAGGRRLRPSAKGGPRISVNETSDVELLYAIHTDSVARVGEAFHLSVWWRNAAVYGNAPSPCRKFTVGEAVSLPSKNDAAIFSLIRPFFLPGKNEAEVPPAMSARLFTLLKIAGQLRSLDENASPRKFAPLRIDAEVVRHVRVDVESTDEDGGTFRLHPCLAGDSGDIPLERWMYFWKNGFLLADGLLVRLADENACAQIAAWMLSPPPYQDRASMRHAVRQLLITTLLHVEGVPADLRGDRLEMEPSGRLFVRTAQFLHKGKEQLHAELSFDYGGHVCKEDEPGAFIAAGAGVIQRNMAKETALKKRLLELGFRDVPKGRDEEPGLKLEPAKLNQAVLTLVMEDWRVTAEGKTYRKPVEKTVKIASGIRTDWFDVRGDVSFGDQTVPLPRLLAALQSGKNSVRLDDGTFGILPIDWLQKYTVLTELGEVADDGSGILLRQRQAALVASLLDDRVTESDMHFRKLVDEWQGKLAAPADSSEVSLDGVEAELRPYQKDGVAWMAKMHHLELGGCLADDMGLGKTLQVLAFLNSLARREMAMSALIVLPSSLVFNWQDEAARFVPGMTVAVYGGAGRRRLLDDLRNHNLVFTTYGIVRNDVEYLAQIEFDYVVLDEAQAIKNADSATAKAVRSLKAHHRISMTGTPVENSLADLFSQMEFLNPGLFGDGFVKAATRVMGGDDDEAKARIRKFLAPFVLRRRKEDVAPDLPRKMEQVLWCELGEEQRQIYDELRDYYQQQFRLAEDDAKTLGANDMLVALLRLRQAACHTAMLHAADTMFPEQSAKLDLLLDALGQLVETGHKTLVFSQFTAFLKLAENAMREHGWKTCYLDGQSKNRGELVRQFQEDAETRIFLISLKAGGTGLNLTAADYVFIMDPWWNPATEAQAIDRAYRIGQTKNVFAYKLIAKDTVEEKVHRLQAHKKCIAESVLAETGAAPLSLDEMRMLLQGR